MTSKWNVDSLHDLMDERDRRYEERFAAQEQAVKTANDVVNARLTGMNEWRKTVSDQTATYMPRAEVETRTSTNAKDVMQLASRMDRMEAKGAGISALWGWIVGAASLGILLMEFIAKK